MKGILASGLPLRTADMYNFLCDLFLNIFTRLAHVRLLMFKCS